MKSEIEVTPDVKSVEELKKLIDQYGARQVEVEELVDKQKSDKRKIEEFARKNEINVLRADKYRLSMKFDTPRLVKVADDAITFTDVVERLKANPATAVAVYEDYDSKVIKGLVRDLSTTDALAYLKTFGLALTEQQRKAWIEEIKRA